MPDPLASTLLDAQAALQRCLDATSRVGHLERRSLARRLGECALEAGVTPPVALALFRTTLGLEHSAAARVRVPELYPASEQEARLLLEYAIAGYYRMPDLAAGDVQLLA